MSLTKDITLPDGLKISLPTGLFINNEFIESKSGKTIDSINPSTGEVNATVYCAEEADVDLAVDYAKKVATSWRDTTGVERGEYLNKLADLMAEDREILGSLEAWDGGKTKATNAVYDVDECVSVLRYYAGWADKIHGSVIQNDPKKLAYTIHEPYGVCGHIIPWNYPLLMAIWAIAPALAAGNVSILKTSEITPLSMLYVGLLVQKAKFPPGTFQILSGEGKVCGNALASHVDVQKISFTGSTATGRLIQKAASANLKAVTLECGGKSPIIIRADADIEQAVKWTAMGIFFNQGQVCTSNSRCYIHADVYEDFLQKLKEHVLEAYPQGPVYEDKSVVGPQVSQMQFDKILGYIDIGKKEGARVVMGGERNTEADLAKGFFIKPTVFADCKPEMRIINEEIFGPVLACSKFSSDEEVLKFANQTEYGLGAAIFTKDIAVAHNMARNIESGMIWINSSNDSDLHVPFGGVKGSGVGRQLGQYGLEHYTQAKAIHVNLGTRL
ncbi:aldehyde dehydrogenase [NAD(P)+] 1 [[Candida] jaroonii]|uniref:Aldehyde dehydrogenase [NAD(P)+] 1 n=1 Tax=[Candida] jaroonii TaxID=467808 RepID=A0ACA9Y8G0_9ASCO|nr:aldehyde dehydrogenase [NAD(P)+] 1 [[Candida] jaroonii]